MTRKKNYGNGMKAWSRASSAGTLRPGIHLIFTFPDAWSRKKIKTPTTRKPGVSADAWNNVYTPADDWSRLKWPGEVKVILLELSRECRGGIYMTVDELAPH